MIETDDKGKSQAVPEKLVEPVLKRFVGRASFNQGKMYVTVDSPTIKNFIVCEDKRKNKNQKIEHGDWLICSLTSHAMEKKGFKAIVKEFITTADDPKAPWTVSLRRLDLPLYAPESDKEFTFNANELEVSTASPFVTIDSEKLWIWMMLCIFKRMAITLFFMLPLPTLLPMLQRIVSLIRNQPDAPSPFTCQAEIFLCCRVL